MSKRDPLEEWEVMDGHHIDERGPGTLTQFVPSHYLPESVKISAIALYNRLIQVDYPYYVQTTYSVLGEIFRCCQWYARQYLQHLQPPVYDPMPVCGTALDDLLCPVCFEQVRTQVLIPCGHTFCHPCISKLSTCPNCRVEISGNIRFYL